MDELWGGAGRDTFAWAADGTGDAYELLSDTVHDFAEGDKVDLRAVGLEGPGEYGDKGPPDGEFSIWSMGGDSYVTWFHDDTPRDIRFEGAQLRYDDVVW